jgi:hypothetical protein
MDFNVNYSIRTFGGIIKIGSRAIECDSEETAKEVALDAVIDMLKDDCDEGKWSDDIESIKVSVTAD